MRAFGDAEAAWGPVAIGVSGVRLSWLFDGSDGIVYRVFLPAYERDGWRDAGLAEVDPFGERWPPSENETRGWPCPLCARVRR